jgi:hypothetical protein
MVVYKKKSFDIKKERKNIQYINQVKQKLYIKNNMLNEKIINENENENEKKCENGNEKSNRNKKISYKVKDIWSQKIRTDEEIRIADFIRIHDACNGYNRNNNNDL